MASRAYFERVLTQRAARVASQGEIEHDEDMAVLLDLLGDRALPVAAHLAACDPHKVGQQLVALAEHAYAATKEEWAGRAVAGIARQQARRRAELDEGVL